MSLGSEPGHRGMEAASGAQEDVFGRWRPERPSGPRPYGPAGGAEVACASCPTL